MSAITMPLFVECSRCGSEVSRHKALVFYVPETGEGWAYCRDCSDGFYGTIEQRLDEVDLAEPQHCSECGQEIKPRAVGLVEVDRDEHSAAVTCRECLNAPVLPW